MHGPLSTVAVWFLYFIGQALHVFMAASDTVNDPAHPVDSYKMYFRTYGVRLVARFFLTTCAFPILWDNKKLLNVEDILTTRMTETCGAGILGYFSDSVWDKVISWLPWLKKTLPSVPEAKP